jgi:serine/threonine protein kinase/WD40 repeat protein/Flp pilus assembly protein TadD
MSDEPIKDHADPAASSGEDAMGAVLESFLARFRKGERPNLDEFIQRYPALADEIREVLPALVEVERLGSVGGPANEASSRGGAGTPGFTVEIGSATSAPGAGESARPQHQRLGDYSILRIIGEGGMGVVYEAERESLKSRVALKVIHARFRTSKNYLRRFRTEARSAAQLHHTNIVPVFDYGEHDGVCYYAMQYIAGHSLDKVLADIRQIRQERGGKPAARLEARGAPTHPVPEPGDVDDDGPAPCLTVAEAPADPLGRTITEGLLTGRFARPSTGTQGPIAASEVATAELGFELRDSAATRMLASAMASDPAIGRATTTPSSSSSLAGKTEDRYFREVAKLGAQAADALDYAHKRNVIHRDIKPSNLLLDAVGNVWVTDFGLAKFVEGEDVSRSRDIVGTLRYMGPERFQGVSDPRCDIYALGATLYEMVALRPAFEGDDQVRLIDQIVHEPPVPPRQIDRTIPRDLEVIILKALAKEPKDRFKTAGELAEELRRFVDNRPIRSRPIPTYEQFWRWCKRNPALAALNALAASLTTFIAIGSTIAAWTYRDQRNDLRYEENKTKTSLRRAERAEHQAVLELGKSLLAEGAALQRTGLAGQRFESLDRLAKAAKVLRGDPDGRARLPELRDHAIAAMGLTDMRMSWQRNIGVEEPVACDRQLERYAIMEYGTGPVVVHRMDNDRELVRLPRPETSFMYAGLMFSPDGNYLIVNYAVGEVGRWNDVWHLGRRERVFHQHVVSLALHPDGRQLVYAPRGKDLILWDLHKGREVKRLRLEFQPAEARFDPEGRRLAIRSFDQPLRVQILEMGTDRVTATWTGPVGTEAMSWSSDGRLLATGQDDGRLFVWDVDRGRLASVLQGHTSTVVDCKFAPEGYLLATRAWDTTVRLWDAARGEPLVSTRGTWLLGFSPDGRRLATLNRTTLEIWDLAHGQEVCTLNPGLIGNRTEGRGSYSVAAAQFSLDNRLAALTTPDGVYLYDVRDGRELAHLKAGDSRTVLFGPDGRTLITYSSQGVFRWPIRHDHQGGAESIEIGPPELLQEVVADWPVASWLPDRHTLAIIDNASARVLLVDTAHPNPARSRARMLSSGSNRRMRSIAVSPDGRWAAAGGWKEVGILVWDLPRRRLERVLRPEDAVGDISSAVAFSPDGHWLVAFSADLAGAPFDFWEVGTWKRGPSIPSSGTQANPAPVFSPDRGLLAVPVSPQQIRLADAATGQTIAHLTALQPLQAQPLAFSADGTRLIASTNQKTALMWDLRRIRARLREMDLDWDQPPYFVEETSSSAAPPIKSIRVIGEVLEPSGRRAADLAAVEQRLRGHPDDGDALIQRGWLQLRLGKPAEALADLERGVSLRHDDSDALFLLAEAQSRTNRAAACHATLTRYLARSPDDVEARLFHGRVAVGLGLTQIAAEEFSRVVEADPSRDGARLRRARVWLSLGRFQEALGDLDEIIRRWPHDLELYELRSQAHERLGHHQEARADLKRASESPRADPMQLNNLAWRLATGPPALRDPERALELARRAVAQTSGSATSLNTLGVCLYRADQYADAIITLEKSLAAGNGQADAYDLFFLAMARYRLGQTVAARADFDRAVQWRRANPSPRGPGWNEELDEFQAEAQAMLGGLPLELPADVFAPR